MAAVGSRNEAKLSAGTISAFSVADCLGQRRNRCPVLSRRLAVETQMNQVLNRQPWNLQRWVGGHNRIDQAVSKQLKTAVERPFSTSPRKPAKPRAEHLGPISTLLIKYFCRGVEISGSVQIAQFGQAICFPH